MDSDSGRALTDCPRKALTTANGMGFPLSSTTRPAMAQDSCAIAMSDKKGGTATSRNASRLTAPIVRLATRVTGFSMSLTGETICSQLIRSELTLHHRQPRTVPQTFFA
jgi:hypothetical protein